MATEQKETLVVKKLVVKPYRHDIHNQEHVQKFCASLFVSGGQVLKPKHCTLHPMYAVTVNDGEEQHLCASCTTALEVNLKSNQPKKT